MRRLTLFISIALAILAFAVPAVAGAKSGHSKRHHHARVADRNRNGIPDRWERRFRVHKATADPDRDGVTNIGEFHNGTNPRDADTDNDGVNDGNDDAEIECEQAASTSDDGEGGDDNSGAENDQGDDNDDQGENENEGNCGTDALQAQTIVKEAELRLTSGGAVFEQIELG